MKRTIFTILAILITGLLFSQEKIGIQTYLYGDLKHSIKGKTLVFFGPFDPLREGKAMYRLGQAGINVVPWKEIIHADKAYTANDLKETISNENIETILLIKLNGTSYEQSFVNTTYNSWTESLIIYLSNPNLTGNSGLVFEIYSRDDGFIKPVAVINSIARKSWGNIDVFNAALIRTLDRVIKIMKKQKAVN